MAASVTDAVKKVAVLSAINTSITRVNGVYERDLSVCSPNVQSQSDVEYNSIFYKLWVLSNTNNSTPTANAGSNYSIPKSTLFILKGRATDADGTASLTYNWEQIDNEIATATTFYKYWWFNV